MMVMLRRRDKNKCNSGFGNIICRLFIMILMTMVALPGRALETQEKQEPAQPDAPPTTNEYVEVSNAEVTVRAFRKGKPVGGLQQSDFILYEDGAEQTLTSFTEIRRKIGRAPADAPAENKAETAGKTPLPKRLFFFYLRVVDSENECRDLLDKFFRDIFRPGDVALLTVQNKVFKITNEEEKTATLPVVTAKLAELARTEKREHHRRIRGAQKILKDFEDDIRNLEQARVPAEQSDARIKELFSRHLELEYRDLWNEYRYKHIHLDTGKLKAIAASLKKVTLQKWGVFYYQTDTFPLFNPESLMPDTRESIDTMRTLRRKFQKLTAEMHRSLVSEDIFAEIRQAFVDADVTFHLMLSEPPPPESAQSTHIRVERIHSDWEKAFGGISRATGGHVVENATPSETLDRFAAAEDIYYRLTYAPGKDGGFTRAIKVTPANKKQKLELRFNSEVVLKAADEISIDGFVFKHPSLDFTLQNYRQLFDGARLAGEVAVKITAIDEDGTPITVKKMFHPEDDLLMVSMKLNFPHGGKYSLILESLDQHTGKTAMFSRKVTVPRRAGELDPNVPVLMTPKLEPAGDTGGADLETILAHAGAYCDKLQKATFYFTCMEEIADSYTFKGERVKHDIYRFDYQIVMDEGGKMDETRTLAKEKNTLPKKKKKRKKTRKKKNDPGDVVITNFYSKYPFLLPVTLLGREHQQRYGYQLLAKEQVGGRDTFKISVAPGAAPVKDAKPMNLGVVWVDALDGSVLKVRLDPRALRGIDGLRKTARRKGAYLKISDVHHYGVMRSGIRFPSGTEISETYFSAKAVSKGNQPPAPVEEVKTVFAYKNYRFFNVNVNVVDSGGHGPL